MNYLNLDTKHVALFAELSISNITYLNGFISPENGISQKTTSKE